MSAGDQVLARAVRSPAPGTREGPHLRGARSGGSPSGRRRAELLALDRWRAPQNRRMMIQDGMALVFDMDGVILDSNPVHWDAWRLYAQRFGIELTDAMSERMYGKRNDEIVRDFFGESLDPDA